jgi:FtsH-binding integral membrane protein
MSLDAKRNIWGDAPASSSVTMNVGLRNYMLKVYNYMASGLALTGLIAMLVARSPEVLSLFYLQTPRGGSFTGLGFVVMFLPVVLAFTLSLGINRMKASTAQALFWFYAGINGVAFSYLFQVYTGTSIAEIFFITAISFLGLSIYGYTTKRDLTAFGSFLIMGLFGLVIASVVNIFIRSAAIQFIGSVLGVLIFAGLTAFDTQKIKEIYWEGDDSESASKKAVLGALTLYLDFINMFLMLLRLFGDRRD